MINVIWGADYSSAVQENTILSDQNAYCDTENMPTARNQCKVNLVIIIYVVQQDTQCGLNE